jgi:hypothetical protein
MAIACSRLVTFFPLRPERSLPSFRARISVSTFFPDEGEYFLLDVALFFAEDLLVAIFLSSRVRWFSAPGSLSGADSQHQAWVLATAGGFGAAPSGALQEDSHPVKPPVRGSKGGGGLLSTGRWRQRNPA